MRKLRADIIHTGDRGFINNEAIVIDDSGKVLDLISVTKENVSECEYYPGMLTPGFINAHCHLELSHLKGRFPTGTKLISFLRNVVQHRESDQEFVLQCISDANDEMIKEGIVAVGDISNKTDTITVKRNSKIFYFSFIEAFDFLQDHMAQQFFDGYKSVYDAFEDLPKSMVPHAPYSVSKTLFDLINETNIGNNKIVSIHNQETTDEDLLFLNKTGEFIPFWESFGFSMDTFQATGKESVYYAIQQMNANLNSLFVHNTQMKQFQIQDVLTWNPNAYFVTCPNANLFIENNLPDYREFINAKAKLCIGTDSLSSNWSLSIFDEIKTILKFNSSLGLEEVLKWACYHGACALKQDHRLGSITIGKTPGINWIQDIDKTNLPGKFAKLKKLI